MKVYVVIDDEKKLTVFSGELVETNLVEICSKVSEHKWSKVLPNWLNLLIPKRHEASQAK